MERESFENREIAELLNREFVPIKVDREERPDVDELYMNAVQMMTGRGGWPLSVFLTPDLKPFFGGTYFPPEDRFGLPGFKTVLTRVAELWRHQRGSAANTADAVTKSLREQARPEAEGNEAIGRELFDKAVQGLTAAFDESWGGFGGAPKFPPSGTLAVLLRRHVRVRDERILRMATHTLDRMAYGGIYDQLGGGFHRYSVDEKWLVPHFEKMLYDNALLSRVYLEAYQLLKNPLYRRIASETLDYVLREMTDEAGGFHSALDADSEGEEGKYYVWTRAGLDEALPSEAAELAADYYGVTSRGNFDGRNILHVPVSPADVARRRGLSPDALDRRLAGVRAGLLAARQERVPPAKDDKVLSSWNGLMISSLSLGCQVLGDERFLDAAERAGAFLLEHMFREGELLHSYRRGQGKISGFLEDYGFVVNALVDLYEASFNVEWLAAADRLSAGMVDLFWDDDRAGFYTTSARHKHLLTRTKSYTDGSVPSGNSVAALALLKLGRLTDNRSYLTKAEGILNAAAPLVARYPRAFTHLLCALDFQLSPPMEIVVAGERDAADTRQLLATVRSRFLPNKVLALRDSAGEGSATLKFSLPLLEGRTMVGGAAVVGCACRKPMTNAANLASLLAVWGEQADEGFSRGRSDD